MRVDNIMQRQKLVCEQCGALISRSNMSKHLRRHAENPESFLPSQWCADKDGLSCKFCGKTCKNLNSLSNHERLCRGNPNNQLKHEPIQGFNNIGRSAWNKGLTKETDARVSQISTSKKDYYKTHEGPFSGKTHSDKTREILRQIAIDREFGGTNRRKTFLHNGVILESSYELEVAKELDANGVTWCRPKRFYYLDTSGNKHHYTPDFYLPDYNVYLDPKNDYLINNVNPCTGYKDVDKITWVCEKHNIRVIVLDKHSLSWNSILDKIMRV